MHIILSCHDNRGTYRATISARLVEEVAIKYYLCTMSAKPKPIFHKRIFWDVNFENLDYENKANFIIERVFERGDVEDIRNCRRYYGDEKLVMHLQKQNG
jgi:hypothetical protein